MQHAIIALFRSIFMTHRFAAYLHQEYQAHTTEQWQRLHQWCNSWYQIGFEQYQLVDWQGSHWWKTFLSHCLILVDTFGSSWMSHWKHQQQDESFQQRPRPTRLIWSALYTMGFIHDVHTSRYGTTVVSRAATLVKGTLYTAVPWGTDGAVVPHCTK